jgi:hypothetical protein
MSETEVLKAAAARAIDYIEGLEDVRVGARLTAGELRARLGKPLPDAGLPAQQVTLPMDSCPPLTVVFSAG